MAEKKDFKTGDKVTGIGRGCKLYRGVIDSIQGALVNINTGGYRIVTLEKDDVFHGHKVTIKIEGEELPERLRMEEVIVPMGNVNVFYRSWPSRVEDVARVSIKMPAHLAKEYREWIEEQE